MRKAFLQQVLVQQALALVQQVLLQQVLVQALVQQVLLQVQQEVLARGSLAPLAGGAAIEGAGPPS